MAKPTVYKWTDPGAPQVQYNSAASYQALFRAVLIDGYGSKLPPGDGPTKWTIPFSDSGSFVLKQGGTQARKCCMKLYNLYSSTSYGTSFNVEKADDYASLSTPVAPWQSASNNHIAAMGHGTSSSYNIPWIIFATERTIICQFGSNSVGTDTLRYDTVKKYNVTNHHWMFGDFKPYDPTMTTNQMFIHRYQESDSYLDHYCAEFNANTSGYSSGREGISYKYSRGNHNDEIGLYKMDFITSVVIGSSLSYCTGQPGGPIATYPNKLDGGLYVEPSRVFADGGFLGIIPGILYPLQRHPFPNSDIVPVINGTGEYAGSKLYAFTTRAHDSTSSTYVGQYFIHDGEWGVD